MAIPEPTYAPVIQLVQIKDIKQAPYNPKGRVSERRLTDLRISIDDMGLFYPVLLDKNKMLVDGHRRLAVAKAFQWKRIPAIILQAPNSHAYGSVQLTQQKLTSNDMLGVYLQEPNALIGRHRRSIKCIERNLGMWAITLAYDAGMGLAAYRTSVKARKYLERHRIDIDLETIFRWVVKHKMAMIGIMIKGGFPAKELHAVITTDRPIEFT